MKAIKQFFSGFLLLITVLWWGSDQSNFFKLADFIAWRNVLVQYSGVIGMSAMSLCVLLAARPAWLESHLDGLDKMYRLHKWLGITALSVSMTHWVLSNAPKWLVALGWLERRGRRQRPVFPEGSWQQLFQSQRGLAENVGEWAFYLGVVLMVLALVKYFPYRRFLQTHRLLAVIYLALVFHAVILLKFDYWASPIGCVMGVLMLLGSVSAIMSLFGHRFSGQRTKGHISAVNVSPLEEVCSVDVMLTGAWPGHQAGQFAFVTFEPGEGAHPFTMASAWKNDGLLRFMIKGLGDYTQQLQARLQVGAPVVIEGPFGCFTFKQEKEGTSERPQLWIAGGIGITPFWARIEALAESGPSASVHLFHCLTKQTPTWNQLLKTKAQKAGVNLSILSSENNERLDLEKIESVFPAWRSADVWFCGPAQFGTSLKQAMLKTGFPAERFHQELFEMR